MQINRELGLRGVDVNDIDFLFQLFVCPHEVCKRHIAFANCKHEMEFPSPSIRLGGC